MSLPFIQKKNKSVGGFLLTNLLYEEENNEIYLWGT